MGTIYRFYCPVCKFESESHGGIGGGFTNSWQTAWCPQCTDLIEYVSKDFSKVP